MRTSSLIAITLTTCALATASSLAFAVDTAQIKVIGHVSPGTCDVALDNNGNFDYGAMTSASLSAINATAATTDTALAEKSTGFNIICQSDTSVALSLKDDRAGTAATTTEQLLGATPTSDNLFGLGSATNGNNIGAYAAGINVTGLAVTNASGAVNTPKLMYNDTSGNGAWTDVTSGTGLFTNINRYLSWGSTGTTPVAATTITGTISVQAVLSPQNSLSHSYDLDGLATLSIQYL